jgi:hypothetical protein
MDYIDFWNNRDDGFSMAFSYCLCCAIAMEFKEKRRFRKQLNDFETVGVFKEACRNALDIFCTEKLDEIKKLSSIKVVGSFFVALDDLSTNTIYNAKEFYEENKRLPTYEEWNGWFCGSEDNWRVPDLKYWPFSNTCVRFKKETTD